MDIQTAESSDRLIDALCREHPERTPEPVKRRTISAQQEQIAELTEKIGILEKQTIGILDRCVRMLATMKGRLEVVAESSPRDAMRVKDLTAVVAEFYGVQPAYIRGEIRTADATWPRHVVAYLAREVLGKSTPVIGRSLGNRDHTTILHSIDKIRKRIANDAGFAKEIEDLKKKIAELRGVE